MPRVRGKDNDFEVLDTGCLDWLECEMKGMTVIAISKLLTLESFK